MVNNLIWKSQRLIVDMIIFAMIICHAASSTVYYRVGDTWQWSSLNLTLGGTLSNTTTVTPYCLVTDLGPYAMNIHSKMAATGTCLLGITTNSNFMPIRVDSGIKMLVNISESISSAVQTEAYLMLGYRRYVNGVLISVTFKLTYQCHTICKSYVQQPSTTFGGVNFNVTNVYNSTAFEMYRNSQTALIDSWAVDIMDVGRYLMSIGWLNPYDRLNSYLLSLTVGKTGDYNFSMTQTFPQCYSYLTQMTYQIGDFIIFNQASVSVTYFQNSDYLNLTMPLQQITLYNINFSSRFVLFTENTSIKAYQHATIGYYNGSWQTPQGFYGLPISLTNKITIMTNFSFIESDYSTPTLKSGCVTFIIRDDYNTSSQSFINGTEIRHTQVRICPWWADSLQRGDEIIATVIYSSKVFDIYTSTETYNSGQLQCKIITFIDRKQDSVISGFDIFSFLRYLIETEKISGTAVIVAISAGFRYYYGSGFYQFQELDYTIQEVEEYPFGTNVTQVNSITQCILMNFNTQEYSCVHNERVYMILYYIVSTPALSLFLRFSPFVMLLDQFSYYSYHAIEYDYSFASFADLAWNITNVKWMPAFLRTPLQNFQSMVRRVTTLSSPYFKNTQVLNIKNESIFFLSMTIDIWMWTMPMGIVAFAILYLMQKIIKIKIVSTLLKPFSSIAYLLINLFGDNVVFFSFRCFTQFYDILPIPQNKLLSVVNVALSMIVLWATICLGIALPLLIYRWSNPFKLDYGSTCLKPYLMISTFQALRVVSGFLHAIIGSLILKITGLTLIQMANFLLICKYSAILTYRNLFFMLSMYTVKLVLNCVLMAEVALGDAQNGVNNNILNLLTSSLVIVLFGVIALNYFIDFFVALYELFQFSSKGTSKVFEEKEQDKFIQTQVLHIEEHKTEPEERVTEINEVKTPMKEINQVKTSMKEDSRLRKAYNLRKKISIGWNKCRNDKDMQDNNMDEIKVTNLRVMMKTKSIVGNFPDQL